MTTAPRVSLIINTADQPDYLARVLHATALQSEGPDEILLADDGSGPETRKVFLNWSTGQSVRTEHVWQPKEGFRRARILNQAIARAESDYLLFLDGDTIPHPKFIEDHRQMARPGRFVQGHRALVGEKAARQFGFQDVARDRRAAFW